jgi:hypothetical protein
VPAYKVWASLIPRSSIPTVDIPEVQECAMPFYRGDNIISRTFVCKAHLL